MYCFLIALGIRAGLKSFEMNVFINQTNVMISHLQLQWQTTFLSKR